LHTLAKAGARADKEFNCFPVLLPSFLYIFTSEKWKQNTACVCLQSANCGKRRRTCAQTRASRWDRYQ